MYGVDVFFFKWKWISVEKYTLNGQNETISESKNSWELISSFWLGREYNQRAYQKHMD